MPIYPLSKGITNLPLALLACLLLATSCKDNGNGPGDPCSNGFDQHALFRNLADNLILPAYEDLNAKVADLRQKTRAFTDAPGPAGLTALRTSWQDAYLSWQQAAVFEFGPAADVFLRNSLNNFPVNAARIDQHIRSGDYSFDNPSAYDKGFPALDYLLFGIGANETEIVSKYTSGDLAAAYRRYLTDVVSDMATRIQDTYTGWTTGGYRAAFTANTGTAAGSSLSLVINQLNEHYEMIKRGRIGIPSGAVTLGFTNPDKVEAYYSGISVRLATEAISASRRLYLGATRNGTNGPGLDDLLNYVKAEKGGRLLDVIIQEQYEAAIRATAAVPDPLSRAVDQSGPAVQKAYNELTRQIVNIKTDLPAVLCVAITYVDNPSDSD